MTTELTIGAINPGYGGLPIGVAAALGGATLAWHAHPGQTPGCPGRTIMRYHHPHAGAHTVIDAIPLWWMCSPSTGSLTGLSPAAH